MPIPEFDSDFDYRGWDCVGPTMGTGVCEMINNDGGYDEMVEAAALRFRRREYEESRLSDGRDRGNLLA